MSSSLSRSISSKIDGIHKYRNGLFGNSNRNYSSPQEAIDRGCAGLVMLRSTNPASPWCTPNLSLAGAARLIEEAVSRGEDRSQFYLSEMLVDQEQHTTLQGEVFRGPSGLTLNYSESKKPMRLALRESSVHIYRTAAILMMKRFIDPCSYQDIMDFLDCYDDCKNKGYPTSHVIEFTTFDCCVGDVPGRNTIIWEVRAY